MRKLLLGLALAWAGLAALREIDAAVTGYDLREQRPSAPFGWRAGTPAEVDLERFLAAARPLLPPGSAVAFASPDSSGNDALFRYRWAAYLLPEVDLLPTGSPAAAAASYALSFRMQLPPTRFVPLARLPGGWAYRVRPAGAR